MTSCHWRGRRARSHKSWPASRTGSSESDETTSTAGAMLRRMLRVATVGGSAAVGAGATALWVDAPQGDKGDGEYDAERKDVFPGWLHDLGRLPMITIATAVSKGYLQVLNNTTFEGVEFLLKAETERKPKQALITVSNHTATVDDPAVIATMLPWKYSLPWNSRWSLVSQEYSYTNGRISRAFFFGAKALPVKRGAGIDQPMLRNLFEKVQEGNWVHVFPEGKIEQRAILGGRSGPRVAEIGLLKWGTAKLIARANVRPIVIPIYHTNMQKIMPQDEHNHIISMVPQTGVNVSIRVGKPVPLDDLFEQYKEARVVGSQAAWETQEHEKAFYSAITKRIEEALLELARDMYEGP